VSDEKAAHAAASGSSWRLRALALALCAAGVGARVFAALVVFNVNLGRTGNVQMLLWWCLPFFVIAVVGALPWRQEPVVGAALAALVADAGVMAAAQGSPDEGWGYLVIMYMPLYNLVFVAPAGAALVLVAIWVHRRVRRPHQPT
jgi:hypothetical protein